MEDVPVYEDNGISGGKQQVGTKRVRVCTGPPTARAGQSNHGWGRAVDFRDSYGIIDCYDTEFHWLKRNAYRFGWVHPAWAHCGIQGYLPAQVSRDEIVQAAREVIAEVGAGGPGDKGKVMPVLIGRLAGRAEGREINEVVTELLATL